MRALEQLLEAQRERIGLWLPVMLACGTGAWFLLPAPVWWAGWAGLWCFVALAAALLPESGRTRRLVQVAALALATGCLLVWAKALLWGERPIERPVLVDLRARVVASEPVVARGLTRLTLVPLGEQGKVLRADLPGRVRVNVTDADRPAGLGVGAIIRTRVRLMPPPPPAVPGAYDYARKAFFDGIGATGRALPPLRVERAAGADATPLRQRLAAHILSRLPGAEGAIAAALATGDTGAITQEDADAMRASGLAHLLSISGLHVSALIGAVMLVLWRTLALSRRLALGLPLLAIAAAGGALAGIGYTLFTGAQVPTVRSCIAALLVMAGFALGREAISLRLVAAGALVVVLFWPEAVIGPSFQMSFMAVTALIAVAELPAFQAWTHARDEALAWRGARALLGLLLTGLAVELALVPIALHHFHQSGMLGTLANLVAIPLTTFVIMPLEAVALLLDVAGLGAPLWWLAGQALGLLVGLARMIAGDGRAVLALPTSGVMTFLLSMGGLLWLALWSGRLRLFGALPVALGLAAMLMAPLPDLLASGDGHHVAVRSVDGRMVLLRAGAGDYMRDILGGVSGGGPDAGLTMGALTTMPGARCNMDVCIVEMERGGRSWRVGMIRSRERLVWADMVRLCAAVDIIIADRWLPRGCAPRWLRLDRATLARTGGAALYLSPPGVRTVRDPGDRHPWVVVPTSRNNMYRNEKHAANAVAREAKQFSGNGLWLASPGGRHRSQ